MAKTYIKSKKDSSKKLIKEFLHYKTLTTISIFAMLFSGLAGVLPSWFVKIAVDGLAAIQNGIENFNILPQQVQNFLSNNLALQNLVNIFNFNINEFKTFLPLAIVFVVAFEAIFKFCYQYTSRLLGIKIVKNIRERFHQHLNKLSLKDTRDIDSGSLVSVISSDLQSLQSWLAESMMNLFSESFKAFFLLSWLFIINWKLTILSTIVIPLFAIPVIKLGKGIRSNAKSGQDHVGKVSTYLSESIKNQSIIKAFNLESIREEGFQKVSNELFMIYKKWALYMAAVSPFTNLIAAFGISAILFYGLNSVLNNNLTVGEFSSFFVTSLLLYDPVKRLGRVSTIFQSALGVADRFYELLEIQVQDNLVSGDKKIEAKELSISIQDLSFGYDTKNLLFKSFNLEIPAKSSIAIVGPSGSGKSTLITLLFRFFEINAGKILLNGIEHKDLELKNLREQFALVSQEPLLFSNSLKENILFGLADNKNLSKDQLDERFLNACSKAHVTEFMNQLPHKEFSDIGEAGNKLSIGQKQRLSIARAFMSYAPVVILDEPTSALDNESQELIYRAINNLMQEKTVIIIAHRLTTIKSCDQIIYLENGKIIEQGKHEELLNQGKAYAALSKQGHMD